MVDCPQGFDGTHPGCIKCYLTKEYPAGTAPAIADAVCGECGQGFKYNEKDGKCYPEAPVVDNRPREYKECPAATTAGVSPF
jgi:hypothetical protein